MLTALRHQVVKPKIKNKSCLGLGGPLIILVIFETGNHGEVDLIAWDHSFHPTKAKSSAFPMGMYVLGDLEGC